MVASGPRPGAVVGALAAFSPFRRADKSSLSDPAVLTQE